MNIPKQNNSDILDNGWWDILPKHYIKWIRLGRFDRPIGFWLLLLPGWWVLPLTNLDLINCIKLMLIFLIGSIVMRAAGCTINDMWDTVIKEYERNKMSFEDAYHQARLARILRNGEYDFATSKPILWSFQYEHYRDTRQGKKAS